MPKHTPGKWQARGQTVFVNNHDTGDVHFIADALAQRGTGIERIGAAEADRNAVLIAQAKELFEAARDFLDSEDKPMSVTVACVNRMRAAVEAVEK